MPVFLFFSNVDRRVFGLTGCNQGENLPAEFAPWTRSGEGGGLYIGPDDGRSGSAASNPVLAAIRHSGFYVGRTSGAAAMEAVGIRQPASDTPRRPIERCGPPAGAMVSHANGPSEPEAAANENASYPPDDGRWWTFRRTSGSPYPWGLDLLLTESRGLVAEAREATRSMKASAARMQVNAAALAATMAESHRLLAQVKARR